MIPEVQMIDFICNFSTEGISNANKKRSIESLDFMFFGEDKSIRNITF